MDGGGAPHPVCACFGRANHNSRPSPAFHIKTSFSIPSVLSLAAVALALVAQIGRPWQFYLWAGVSFGLILPLTVLVHELGHVAAARCVGTPAHSILLWPLGGLAFLGRTASPGRDLGVAIAGPLTHAPQVGVWLLVQLFSFAAIKKVWIVSYWLWPPADNVWLAITSFGVQINVSLFAFNLLLPAYPLDGGRILADLLLLCSVPVKVAAAIVVALSLGIGGGVIAYGFKLKSILTTAVGVYVVFAGFELLAATVRGLAAQHPLFDYKGSEGGNNQNPSTSPGWGHWGSGTVGGGGGGGGPGGGGGVSMDTQPPPPPPAAWAGAAAAGAPAPAAPPSRPAAQQQQPNAAMLGGYEPSAPV